MHAYFWIDHLWMTVFIVCKHEPNHVVCTVMVQDEYMYRYTPTLNVSWGLWHQDISSRSYKSYRLWGGASVDWICWSSSSNRCSIWLKSGETPWTLSCSSNNFLNIFAVFCPKRPLRSENTTVPWRGCMWSTTIFRSMVYVKDPHASTQGFPAEHWPDHNTAFVILLPSLPQVNDVHAPTIHLI